MKEVHIMTCRYFLEHKQQEGCDLPNIDRLFDEAPYPKDSPQLKNIISKVEQGQVYGEDLTYFIGKFSSSPLGISCLSSGTKAAITILSLLTQDQSRNMLYDTLKSKQPEDTRIYVSLEEVGANALQLCLQLLSESEGGIVGVLSPVIFLDDRFIETFEKDHIYIYNETKRLKTWMDVIEEIENERYSEE